MTRRAVADLGTNDGKFVEGPDGEIVYVSTGEPGERDPTKSDKIVKREGKFCAVSADGARSFGCFDTLEQANERLRQVEAAKAAKGDDVAAQLEMEMRGDSVFRIDRIGPIHFDKDREDGFFAEITPEGFLRCDGRMTRTGVLFYSDGEGNEWGEFLDESEVFDEDSLASFQMLVITDDHPAGMVNADNVHEVQVGHTGSDARRDGEFMRASLLVTDKDVIRSIQDGKVELSLGYFAQVIQDAGVAPDGTPFTHRQTNRRGNHLAFVDEGRAGPECLAMLDSAGAFTPEEIFTMPPKKTEDEKKEEKKDARRKVIAALIADGKITAKDAKILVGGEEHEVSDDVAEAFNQMAEKMEQQAAELSKLTEPAAADADVEGAGEGGNAEEVPAVVTDDKKNTDAMQAQIDALKGQLKSSTEGQAAVIDARVALVVKAKEILPEGLSLDGVAAINIKRAVVAHVLPSMKDSIKDKSADYVQAAYDMACEQYDKQVDSSGELLDITFDAASGASDDEDIDKIYADSVARIGSGGRTPAKKEAS